jgi:RNA polymerase primary sigma factor
MGGLDHYFKMLGKCKSITREEERELLTQARSGNQNAYNRLMSAHLKFVVSVAKQYQHQGLSLDELIAEGNLGLVKAFNKFDLTRTNNFITYAVWWIRQSIMNSIHEHAQLIRLPVNKITNLTKISHLKHELSARKGRTPTTEELHKHLADLGYERLLKDVRYAYSYVALDAPQTENKKTLEEVIPTKISTAEKDEFLKSLKEELATVLKHFSKREQQIIYMYFGINQIRTYTLEEIGVDLGLTRERIRQIKQKVLQKLKSKRLRGFLQPFLYDELYNE